MLRLIIRQLRRSKWFVAYVASFLAIAVAAYIGLSETTAALFSTRFPGVRDAESLVRFAAPRLNTPFPVSSFSFSKPEAELLQAVLGGKVDAVEAYGNIDAVATSSTFTRPVHLYAVSRGFFRAVGSVSAAGSIGWSSSAGDAGLIVTEAFVRSLGKRPEDLIGNSIRLNGSPWTIQGVVKDFGGLDGTATDAAFPVDGISRLNVGSSWLGEQSKWLRIIVRARPGLPIRQLTSQAASLLRSEPVAFDVTRLSFENLNLALAPERSRRGVILLLAEGMSIALLAILLTNLTQLLMVRRLSRGHEFAVHDALGAGSLRLAVLAAAEPCVALGAGLLIGLFLAKLVSAPTAISLDLSTTIATSVGQRVAIGVVVGVAAVAAVVPVVLSATGGRTFAALRQNRDGSRSVSRALDVMLAIQILIATSTIVLTATSADNLSRLSRVDYGFDPAHLYAVKQTLGIARADNEAIERIVATLRRSSEFAGVSVVNSVPTQSFTMTRLYLRGPQKASTDFDVEIHYVDSAFFAVSGLGIRLLDPNALRDWRSGAAVVVLSASADSAYRAANRVAPVCVAVGGPDVECRRVVGVAPEANFRGFMSTASRAAYVPVDTGRNVQPAILVRATSRPGVASLNLQNVVNAAQDERSPMQVHWIQGDLDAQSAPWRSGLRLMLIFCVLAILIAAVGVASIGLRTVQVRRRDIGVALALGASQRVVIRQFLGRSASIAVTAAVIALFGAGVLVRRFSSVLILGERISYLTVFVAAFAITTVSVCLGLFPPLRSMRRIEPVEILKGTN